LITVEEERRKRRQLEDAEGLSMLCSQHHKSEYNRLKWGDKGSFPSSTLVWAIQGSAMMLVGG
jgi:hypothetical protein